MGDRGNVLVKEGNEEVYLYTHWDGSSLPEIVRAALKRGGPQGPDNRWHDAPYLTRIIFSEMIQADLMDTSGYGIWPTEGDGGKLVVVDVENQTVTDTDNNIHVSFQDFVDGKTGREHLEDNYGGGTQPAPKTITKEELIAGLEKLFGKMD